jgi:hypothetical protein
MYEKLGIHENITSYSEQQKNKTWFDSEHAKHTLIDNGEKTRFTEYLQDTIHNTMKRSMADLNHLATDVHMQFE